MAKQECTCAQCGDVLRREPINPNTKLPILNFFCNHTCKGKWQIRQREASGFTKEWLIDQYITQGKDANQIGREIGRDGKSVWNWMTGYGIPTRPRGYDTSHLPKDGSVWRGKKHSMTTKKKLSALALEDGRVPWGKDNKPYWIGKKGVQHPSYKGGLTPERQAVYISSEWVDAVKKVWARDNATCQRCGVHHNTAKTRGNFHIHHIVSFQCKALQTEPSNLVLLCKACHKFVHGKHNTERKFIKEQP